MKKSYVYKSVALHIAVVLLCVLDVPFLKPKRTFDNQPPIMVNLDNVKIADVTNLPEKAERGPERKPATRKEKPDAGNFTPKETKAPEPEPIPQKEPEPKPEPAAEEKLPPVEIKEPSLIEEVSQPEEIKEEPKKEEKKPEKKKGKPAPIPQKKPQVKKAKPENKPSPDKTPDKNTSGTAANVKKGAVKSTNPLQSLMNSVDDLQKQIGEEDAPAQVPYDEEVNNLGVEGGNSRGSYFSEISVSGIDFVKSKIQESWTGSAGGKDDRNIEIVINVKLTKEGLIQSATIADMKRYRSDNYFQALADSAERAIRIAQDSYGVFKVLATQNSSQYNDWKEINFTFTPLGLAR